MVYLGADHGGYALKERIKDWLLEWGEVYTDLGANVMDENDDYPVFALEVAKAVASDESGRGILLCRSGGGMVMVANKLKSVRAVAVSDVRSAIHAREHNNANIISLAADWVTEENAKAALAAFLQTPFTEEERHVRRLKLISNLGS